MKRVVAVVLFMALVLGTCSMALASEVSKPTIKEENVDLIVKVAQWATISKPNTMTLDLTEPGKSYSISQDIVIGTNTNVTVKVSQPQLDNSSDAFFEAITTGAFDWGLGFLGNNSGEPRPGNSFDIDACNQVIKQLLFWAEWKEDNWWTLPAADYHGTAIITVQAR